MKHLSISNYLLFVIIALGVTARLINFGSLPTSLNRDEVALGYNAYSIGNYGIDEWGEKLPIMFKSFGDYKLPGYIYTLVPLIKFFGTSEWVVRLPSVIAGLVIIYLTFLLGRILNLTRNQSMFAAAAVAISPWAIFYSRVGFEANLGLAFFMSSLVLVSQKNIHSIFMGVGLFLLAIVTYNTPLLLTPVLLAILTLNQSVSRNIKVFTAVVISLIAVGWLYLISPLVAQKSGITIFSDPTIQAIQNQNYQFSTDVFARWRYNRYIDLGFITVKNFSNSIHPQFLVSSGGPNPWHSLPGKGHIYWTTYLLAIFGLAQFRGKNKKTILHLAGIVAFGFLPAIFTIDAPHATRSLISFVGLTLLSAIYWSKNKKIDVIITIAILIELFSFYHSYFYQFSSKMSPTWQDGLKQAIIKAQIQYPNQNIIITEPKAQPYIYTLFYTLTPTTDYLDTVTYYGPDSAGIESIESFGRWLYIGDIRDAPPDIPVITRDKQGEYSLFPSKQVIQGKI